MTILFVKGEMRSRWIFRNMLASLKHLGIASFDGKMYILVAEIRPLRSAC